VADELLSSGKRFFGMDGSERRPCVENTMSVDQEIAGCGVRNGPRDAAHPATGLEVLVPAFAKTFLRLR